MTQSKYYSQRNFLLLPMLCFFLNFTKIKFKNNVANDTGQVRTTLSPSSQWHLKMVIALQRKMILKKWFKSDLRGWQHNSLQNVSFE